MNEREIGLQICHNRIVGAGRELHNLAAMLNRLIDAEMDQTMSNPFVYDATVVLDQLKGLEVDVLTLRNRINRMQLPQQEQA
jgi:hypothetical protein